METSRAMRSGDADTRSRGMGVLLAVREEWAETEAGWQEFCEQERTACGDDTETVAWITGLVVFWQEPVHDRRRCRR